MGRRYFVFDVETPNEKADSMCAVGIACLDEVSPGNFEITEDAYTLVDPEDYFSVNNIMIHGITQNDVKFAPKFRDVWQEFFLPRITEDTVFTAHNAPFDMGVLAKSLKREELCCPVKKYLCTVRMGRVVVPWMPDHKLNTMAEIMKIELDHHNAASDALCCAKILKNYMDMGSDPENYIRTYDFANCRTEKPGNKGKNNKKEK